MHNAAFGWLNADRTARMIVNADCMIIWANRSARNILTEKRWIETKGDSMMLLTGCGLGSLTSELSKLHDEDILVHAGVKTGDDDILLVARMLPDAVEQDALYGIELRRQNQDHEAQYAGYRSYFGLTPAEDRVVQQLLSGHVVEKCADNLDISVDTVRSHVRQIYSKMGISSREALFHALMIFRIY
ncbi:helix-turn-helix transcriptional regulator [Sphingobium sp.]|uniref:helix-turn-helix transcriptional regulator n=1 Tax=Sphingobium sp. TaxID=1912891 RepID=UPI003B3AC723